MSVIELQPDKTKACEAGTGLFLRIADITFALVCEPRMMTRIDGTARKFLVEETETDVRVRATWGDLSDESGGELIFDSGALWRLYREDSDYVFRFTTPYFGATPYKTARFNDDFSEGEVIMHHPYFADRDGVNPLEYPLDELLMLNLLAQGRGAELHSCGLVDETGAGYLFIGQSGAGKTTTARLWEREPQVRILSDDRIIVRRETKAFWMHGTPWHGEGALALPERAPLKRIFFLKHGERNELAPLERVEASARLFSCSFPTFYNTDGLSFTLAFFDELTEAVPCSELSFVPEQGVVDFIREQATVLP